MTPFDELTFYTPYGNYLMFVSQPDLEEVKLKFDTDGGSATLSWHQVKDLHNELGHWLSNNKHLAKREN